MFNLILPTPVVILDNIGVIKRGIPVVWATCGYLCNLTQACADSEIMACEIFLTDICIVIT